MNSTIPKYPVQGQFLKDKVVLITGGTSGIGKALALACAHQQAEVILLGRNVRKLEAVADQIETEASTQIHLYPLNMAAANDTDYSDLAETLSQKFGRLHGLVHNAAALGNLSPFKHYSLVQWYKVMQTNVNGPMVMTQALLPLLETSDHASIIWTSSGVAQNVQSYWGAYGVSKCANDYMMQLIATEYAESKLRCNAINPGPVATGMRAKAFPGEDPNTLRKPRDILDAWLYLLSDDSIGVNGQRLQAQ